MIKVYSLYAVVTLIDGTCFEKTFLRFTCALVRHFADFIYTKCALSSTVDEQKSKNKSEVDFYI